jgi:uncharacterized membrane protein YidH (DUF202 family)
MPTESTPYRGTEVAANRTAEAAEHTKETAVRTTVAAQRTEASADRRTELAANRTVLAAERTCAAWVRTGLMSLVAGVGAKTQCPRETAFVGPGRRYARRQLAPDGGGEAC